MKKPLTIALLATLSAAAPAQAQLATYCDSPSASWCFSVTQFSYVEAIGATLPGLNDFRFTLSGVWSGSGMSAVSAGMWYYYLDSGDAAQSLLPGAATFTPGLLTSATGSTDMVTPGWSPTLDDLGIGWYSLGEDGGTGFCSVGPDGCYSASVSVPEPGAGLLILTGLLALGFVARRGGRAQTPGTT